MEQVKQALTSVFLSNDFGMTVEIINFGARIKSIKFPVNSVATEMTLGYESAEEYLHDDFYLGATCGRVCNRIDNGQFELNGKTYQLSLNDGENCLHGGEDNFSFRYWKIDENTLTTSSVTLRLLSKNGDQGFPGNLELSVKYHLNDANKLEMEFIANTDHATPVNITNHTYFNLGDKDCESLYLQMPASTYLESDRHNIPTGELVSVSGTDYDFRERKNIGQQQKSTDDKSLIEKNGYDHCFILEESPFEHAKAIVTSVNNQVSLTVYTDQPAIQVYTGFYLNGQFKPYQGMCLEAQNYTDADNHDHFTSNIIEPNQQYKRKICYEFTSL